MAATHQQRTTRMMITSRQGIRASATVFDQPQGHRHAVPDLRDLRGRLRRLPVGDDALGTRRAGHPDFHGLAQMVYGVEGDSPIDAGKHMYNVFTTGHGLIMIFFMVMPA
jgi:hypothetical protein